jgi:hypothetical protein
MRGPQHNAAALAQMIGNRAFGRLLLRQVVSGAPVNRPAPDADIRQVGQAEARAELESARIERAEATGDMNAINRVANDVIEEALGGPLAGTQGQPRPPQRAGNAPGVPQVQTGPRVRAPLAPGRESGPESPNPGAWRVRPIDHTIQDLRRVISQGGAHVENAQGLLRQLEAARVRDGQLSRRIENAQRRLNEFSEPSSSGGSGQGETPVPRERGGGGAGAPPPRFTAGQKVTAVAAGAAIVLNDAFNIYIRYQNDRDIKAELKRKEAQYQADQARNPGLGLLFVFRFTGGRDSLQGPTAETRFQHVTWVQARNESEARAKVTKAGDEMHLYSWIPPLAPQFDWENDGLAKFADVSKMEFQRLEFAQVGGFKVKGRSYPANLSKKVQQWALALRFFVLRPPAKISYRGVRGGSETESLRIEERDVVDGRVGAMMIHGTPIVPVIAADAQTLSFFRADADLSLDHSGVVTEGNIDEIRWLLPEQVEMVGGLQAQTIEFTKKHPNWEKELPFGKDKANGTGDPGLQWDRDKGRWVQKKVH